MDAEFAKVQFRSLMVVIRHLSEHADPALAEKMYRELDRELGVLAPKFRRGNDFLKNPVTEESVIHS